mmetsp:Transcript_10244/g.21034  ORF Transcript_10244/g.21034 Transcript_10244/m.21034 type:complete len:485 (-) Transcript_10244:734-2188(-)
MVYSSPPKTPSSSRSHDSLLSLLGGGLLVVDLLVQPVNHLLVLQLELGAAELEGRGEEVLVDREPLSEVIHRGLEGDLLGELEGAELGGLAACDHVVEDHLLHLRVLDPVRHRPCPAVLLRPRLHHLDVWGDDDDDKVLVRVAVHPRLQRPLGRPDRDLHRLRRHVLALSELEDILLAVHNRQRAVRVPHADVSRVEPAVGVLGLLGILLVLVVALEDVLSAQAHLSARHRLACELGVELALERDLRLELFLRCGVLVGALVGVCVLQLHLQARDGPANVAALVVAHRHHDGSGAILRHAVPLQHRAVEHSLEEMVKVRGERSSARSEETDAASEFGLDLLEEEGVVDEPGLVGGHAPVVEDLGKAALLLNALCDLVEHPRVDARHAGHDCGAKHGNVFSDELPDVAAEEANGGAHQDGADLHAGLERVREREEGDVDVVITDELHVGRLVEEGRRRCQHVLVREDYALRVARRSRRVHDVRPV